MRYQELNELDYISVVQATSNNHEFATQKHLLDVILLYRSAPHFLHLSNLSSPEDGTCIDESENSTRQYRLDTVASTHNCGNCCCEKGPAHTQGVEYCNRKGIPHVSHLC